MEKVKIGAVVYDPKVTIIWGIIEKFFENENYPIKCIFYKDYKLQVDALMNKEIDIAWNSPLAWLDTYLRTNGTCKYASMRDTDRDRCSYFITRKDSGIKTLGDLKGKTIGFGAYDSPQARLIPINSLKENGLEYNEDYIEHRFEIGLGLNGDHVGGEKEALEALKKGEVDASVCIDLNYESWKKDGTLDENDLIIIYKTDLYDHCIFTAHPDFSTDTLIEWDTILNKMDYNNPDHKEMMDMEGLKKWVPGRLEGFKQIKEAVEYLDFFK